MPLEAEIQLDERVVMAGVMVIQSYPARAIEFAVKVWPVLKERGLMSITEMAQVYGCTTEAARRHVKRLTARGFLERVHYRAWKAALHNLEGLEMFDEQG